MKEQYIVSQAVIDHLLPATKVLVSDLLTGITNNIRDSVSLPISTMELIESKITLANTSLFNGLASPFLQKSFFKKHFNLVVSYPQLC